MNIVRKFMTAAAVFVTGSGLCLAQSSSPGSAIGSSTTTSTSSGSITAPYTEGTVWQITMVRTKPGFGDEYLKNLAKVLKASLDEEKKEGIIVSYKILLGDAATPNDFNIVSMVEYKNMAALDNLREKTDPIAAKIIGGEQQIREGAMKRGELREIVGTKLMREITLK